jgi:hypothetical protein
MARCAYLKKGRACAKNGIGNPPLCATHRAQLQPVVEEAEAPDLMSELVDNLFDHPQMRGVFGQISATLDRFGHIIERVSHGKAPGPAAPRAPGPSIWDPPPPRRRTAAPPPPPPVPDDAAALKDAFIVLGIKPGTPLTIDLVKGRRRELTKLFHPDRGVMGNDDSMKRINAACDLLLAKTKPKV